MSEIVVTPTKFQRESTECMAVALWIILAYHKKYVTMEELRIKCKVSRDGGNILDVMQTARNYGMKAQAHKRGTLVALKEMKMPFLAYYNYNHAVVVEGVTDEAVYINDGLEGRKKISHTGFDDGFTGVVVSFSPTTDFKTERKKKNWTVLKTLSAFFQKEYKNLGLLGLIALAFASCCIGLASAGFKALVPSNTSDLDLQWSIILLIAGGLMVIVIKGYILKRLAQSLTFHRNKVFSKLFFDLPMTYFYQNGFKTQSVLIHVNQAICKTLPLIVYRFFFVAGLALITGVMLFAGHLSIGMIHLAVLIGFFFCIGKRWRQYIPVFRNAIYDYSFDDASFPSFLEMLQRAKLHNKERSLTFGQIRNQTTDDHLTLNILAKNVLLDLFPKGMLVFSTLSTLAITTLSTASPIQMIGWMSLSLLFSVMIYRIWDLIPELQFNYNLLAELNRVEAQYHVSEGKEQYELSLSELLKTDHPLFSLKQVSFGFKQGSNNILSDFNLEMERGAFIAVMGPSGSGKSILSYLLTAIHEPTEGEILVLGHPIAHFSSDQIKQLVALVTQESRLFRGTIRENLTLWDDTVSDQRLREVMDMVCLNPGIELNQKVMANGLNFEKCMQQRLEIARALINEPQLIIIDEGTNALGLELEKTILARIKAKGIACLFITHITGSLPHFDQVLVMEDGKVIQHKSTSPLKHTP